MVITARFASTCPRCNNPIAVGSSVNWERGSKATHTQCPAARAAAAPAAPAARRLNLADVGVYVGTANADNVYRVRKAQTSDNVYAQAWAIIGGQRSTDAGTVQHGEYRYEDAAGNRYSGRVAAALDSGKLRRMTPAEAIAFAVRYSQCANCGAHLKDADSVDAGMGPVCAAKLGIDRKSAAQTRRAGRAAAVATATAAQQPATPARTPRSYAEVFGDDEPPAERFNADGSVAEPDAPANITPANTDERLAARQRWADGVLPTGGYSIRRRRQYGHSQPAQSVATVGRWSRPSDDDLGHAAGLGADSDDYAF
jgi:hypothetical protein